MSEFLGLVLITLIVTGSTYWSWRGFRPGGFLEQGRSALHPRFNRVIGWSGVVVAVVLLTFAWGEAIHGWLE